MTSLTDLPRARRGLDAAALLVVLAVLVLTAGWALGAVAPAESAAGVPVAAVVGASHTTATADAYRRFEVSRLPHQLPAVLAMVAVLVVIARGRRRSPTSRAAAAPLPVWHSAWGSRGPPPRLLV